MASTSHNSRCAHSLPPSLPPCFSGLPACLPASASLLVLPVCPFLPACLPLPSSLPAPSFLPFCLYCLPACLPACTACLTPPPFSGPPLPYLQAAYNLNPVQLDWVNASTYDTVVSQLLSQKILAYVYDYAVLQVCVGGRGVFSYHAVVQVGRAA